MLRINDGSDNSIDETDGRMPAVANNSIEIDLANVDDDGGLDVVVANLGASGLLINDGNGYFSPIDFFDLNNDDSLDIMVPM